MAQSNAPTTAQRSIRIPDDQWAWLEEWSADNGMDRASAIRRLLTILQHDAAAGGLGDVWRTHHRVATTDDPIPAKRQANLLHQPGGAQ